MQFLMVVFSAVMFVFIAFFYCYYLSLLFIVTLIHCYYMPLFLILPSLCHLSAVAASLANKQIIC